MTFTWNERKARAAEQAAEDKLTNTQIAEAAGVSLRAYDKWRAAPEFRARIAAILEDNRQRLRDEGLANRQNRIDLLDDMERRIGQVITERAADPGMEKVPGGKTGLIVRRWHTVTAKDGTSRSVPEYAVDTSLMKERRETAKQAAQETGQWTDKSDVTTNGQSLPSIQVYQLPAKAAPPDPQTE